MENDYESQHPPPICRHCPNRLAFQSVRTHRRTEFASNNSYAVEYMIVQGLYIGQMSAITADKWIAKKHLVEILPQFDAPAFEVFMLYAAHRYRSAIVKAFVEFVLKNPYQK